MPLLPAPALVMIRVEELEIVQVPLLVRARMLEMLQESRLVQAQVLAMFQVSPLFWARVLEMLRAPLPLVLARRVCMLGAHRFQV